jgi:hypothetical protein
MASACALTACASLLGPRTIEISRDELQGRLGKQFPVSKRVANVMEIVVATPQLRMLPDQEQVATDFALNGRDMFTGRSYTGHISLRFGLRYEPSDLTIRLTKVKIDQVELEGFPPVFQQALTTLGAPLVEQNLQGHVVRQLKPEDLRQADRMGYQVDDIKVTATGLAVHLSPRKEGTP